MPSSRASIPTLLILAAMVFAGCSENAGMAGGMAAGGNDYPNVITGEGFPNPNPNRIGSWATLPEGREWGSTAGMDTDPTDGHVWGYERCASGSAGGPGVNCDNNPVDPIFKFDRNTGEVLANFGAGVFVTPTWHLRPRGRQRLGHRLRRQRIRHQGPSGPQVQPGRRAAHEPRHSRAAR